jgi:hypothetical protein
LFFQILCSFQGTGGGDKEIRTLDPLLARQVLSQLSYTPISKPGLNGPGKINSKYKRIKALSRFLSQLLFGSSLKDPFLLERR